MPGIVTILFTDLVDSTRLLSRLGEDGADSFRRDHFALLREAVVARGGQEVKNVGDGLMVVFPSAVEAVASATAMQQAAHRHNQQHPDQALGIRIGLHVGEPTREDDDYFGTPVVVAKRLCDSADGGQIIASDLVRALAIGRGGSDFRALGPRSLKGLDEEVAAFEVVWEPLSSALLPLQAELSRGTQVALVGRAAEFDRLRTAWKQALEGSTELVLVAGEPGIGKTRLASELAKAVHEEGAAVLLGRCDELSSVPYRPFVEALTHLVVALPDELLRDVVGSHTPRIATLVPELTQRLGEADRPDVTDPETDRFRLFEAVTAVFSAVTTYAPLLLVLDDLHWADAPSLHLLRHVLRAQRDHPVLIIGTYRETDLGRAHPLADVLAELRRQDGVERMHLKGFGVDAIVEWLGAAGGHDVGRRGRRLAEALYETTEGNPFFVQQIVLNFVETGRLVQRDGVWTFDVPLDQLGIPEGVREVVGRRLARLSENCNKTLDAASVIGREFELGILDSMLSDGDVLGAIDEALANQVIVEVAGVKEPGYSFVHALMRQTLYEELHLARKQRLHLKAAEAIEHVHSRDLDLHIGELAAHFRLAGAAADPKKAIEYSIRAGEIARTVAAYDDAAKHWLAAVELLDEEGDRGKRASVLERLGDLMYVSGIDPGSGIVYLERALSDLEAIGDTAHLARVHSRLGRSLIPPGPREAIDFTRAWEHFRAAEAILAPQGPSLALGLVYVGMETAARLQVRQRDGLEAAERALAVAEHVDHAGLHVGALAEYGVLLVTDGRVDESTAILADAFDRAEQSGIPWLLFHASMNSSITANFLYDNPGQRRAVERVMGNERLMKAPGLRGQLIGNLAGGLMDAGELDKARELEDEAEALAGDVRAFLGAYRLILDGRFDEAEERIDLARGSADRGHFVIPMQNSHHFGYGTHYVCGDLEATRSTAQEYLERARTNESPLFEMHALYWLALVDALLRRPDLNGPRLDRLREIAGAQNWRGLAGRIALAEAATRAALGEPADHHFEEAIAIALRYENVWFRAEVHRVWGLFTGDRGKFDAAIEIYDSIGAVPFWAERVRKDMHA